MPSSQPTVPSELVDAVKLPSLLEPSFSCSTEALSADTTPESVTLQLADASETGNARMSPRSVDVDRPELSASVADSHRRILNRARHELLDVEDLEGALTERQQQRLDDIEAELAAMDQEKLAASTHRYDVWAEIDSLAERVLAAAGTDARDQ